MIFFGGGGLILEHFELHYLDVKIYIMISLKGLKIKLYVASMLYVSSTDLKK